MKKSHVGFVVLAHENIFRVREVIQHLLNQNAPIALHIDKKIPKAHHEILKQYFSKAKHLYFIEPHDCQWGQWSIVEALLDGTKALLKNEPKVDYVYHISGSCLPIRPINELRSLLSTKDPVDYIESIAVGEEKWVVDGLDRERVELFHPFNWRAHRRLFNFSVKIQRMLKIKRKMPKGLVLSFGSQWWCLSRQTLQKIFSDPDFETYTHFFKRSWIPDESFLQTLARKHSFNIASSSLTYVNFDHTGKPFLFYDDHLPTLQRLDRFFIRKVWSGASGLYSHFLNPLNAVQPRDASAEIELRNLLDEANKNCITPRQGLISQFSTSKGKRHPTTRSPYYIYVGFDAWKQDIYDYFAHSSDILQAGHLFHRGRIESVLGRNNQPTIIHGQQNLRDYDQIQFLQQQIWYSYPKQLAFLAKPHHLQNLSTFLCKDKNANIFVLEGAWILELMTRNINNIERLRSVCDVYLKREKKLLNSFQNSPEGISANLTTVTLGEFLTKPKESCASFPENFRLNTTTINNINMTKLSKFINKLSANGVSLHQYKLDMLLLAEVTQDKNVIQLNKHAG